LEEKIRLYSREELNGYEKDRIIGLLLEMQESALKSLAEYTEMSRKLSNALEEIRLLKAKLFGRSTEAAGPAGMDKNEPADTDSKTDTEEKEHSNDTGAGNNEEATTRRRPKRTSG